MTIFFSPSKSAFYNDAINAAASIPGDKIKISTEQHSTLLACLNSGGTVQVDANGIPQPVSAPAPTLAQVQASLCGQIDATADQVYASIGGPSPGRMAEYKQAKEDATAFKAAGYSGTVPKTVQVWATAQNFTAQQAADSILSTAAAWESVLENVREARLIGKANVNAATTTDDANTAAQTAISNVQSAAAGA